LDKVAAIYNVFFLTSNDVIKLRLRSLSDYKNLDYRYVMMSKYYRIRSAKVSIHTAELQLELHEVT
jgi:hypothetical protein